jgi:hypothetical protein
MVVKNPVDDNVSQHSAMAELDLSQIFFNICKKKTKKNLGLHWNSFTSLF